VPGQSGAGLNVLRQVPSGGAGQSRAGAEAVKQTLVLDRFPDPEMARCLSPNGRAHWASKKQAREYVAQHVWYCARMQGLEPMLDGVVTMWPTFIYPVHRRRDDDNLASGILKSLRDCLVRRRLIEADDLEHLRQMPVEVRVERGRRALELRFEVAAPRGTDPGKPRVNPAGATNGIVERHAG
jgi:hypothetical protein